MGLGGEASSPPPPTSRDRAEPGVGSPQPQALGLLFRRPSGRVEQGLAQQQHVHPQPVMLLERDGSGAAGPGGPGGGREGKAHLEMGQE